MMKILIVEDEPELLGSLKEYAAQEEFIYDAEADYAAALERISLYDYDCIILDINLPDGSEFDLSEVLRQKLHW